MAKDILDNHDRVLVTAGTALRQETLASLTGHRVESIPVKDARPANRELASVPNLVSEAARLKMRQTVQKTFCHSGGIAANLPVLRECIDEVIEELSGRDQLLIYLSDIRRRGGYLFAHCVDVGVFAVALGLALGLPREDVFCLGIGGLLHDYGKTYISDAILEKRGGLTLEEFEEVKRHASLGYNALRREPQIDPRISLIALQHHERPDRRGYPWGAGEDEIHFLARIVAVADVYDALITDRVYRPGIPAFQAINIITSGSGFQFDPQVIGVFRRIAVPYCIGAAVKLNNGLSGVVATVNSAVPARPAVKTGKGIINLLHEPELDIVYEY